MDAFEAEEFLLLAGPLEGTEDVLLIFRARDAEQIETRLAEDPWTQKNLLRTKTIAQWKLRLGTIGER